MSLCEGGSIVVALFLSFPLAWQILEGKVKQNIATWILWVTLDALATISIFMQDGNWYLPAIYTAEGILTILCILKTRTVIWTRFETISSVMVVLCLIGWKMFGPELATIFSTGGMVLAGLPQIKDAYQRPTEMPFSVYLGSTVVSALSVVGGESWTVEERLYPLACFVLCGVIMGISCRKFLSK